MSSRVTTSPFRRFLEIEDKVRESGVLDSGDWSHWPAIRIELIYRWLREGKMTGIAQEAPAGKRIPLRVAFRLMRMRIRAGRKVLALVVTREGNLDWRIKEGQRYDNRFDEICRLLKQRGIEPVKVGLERDLVHCKGDHCDIPILNLEEVNCSPGRRNADDLTRQLWAQGVAVREKLGPVEGLKSMICLSHFRGALGFRELWDRVLNILKPKYIFVENYYSPWGMGLMYEGARRRIPTVDIAHGTQGPEHAGYSGVAHESGNSPWLPDHFWCWNKETVERVKEARGDSRPHPVLGGNVSFGVLDQIAFDSGYYDPLLRELGIPGKERVALVTLQNRLDLLPDFFEEVVARTEETSWIFRIHPHFRDVISDDELIERFVPHSTSRVAVSSPGAVPLPLLLKHADFHLTHSSSVCMEAAAVGVPTVFFGLESETLFRPGFEEGWCFLAECEEDVRKVFDSAGFAPLPSSTEFLEVSVQAASAAMDEIINHANEALT